MMELFRPLDSRGRRHPWTVLYLGLDPESCPVSGRIYHYPVIRTSSLPEGQSRVKQVWSECTHVLFTSKRAVHYLSSSLLWEGKTVLAIGEGTAQALRAFGIEPRVAPIATQEGCLALLQQLDCVNKQICWPRSKNSRDFLERHLPHARIVDLYETNCFSPGAPPLLSEIDEVVFMSPSCVEGFCRIYGTKLPNVKISVQGPITATACRKWFGVDRMAIHQPRDEQ
jgi:uroporphyrinogen-III synthase